MADTLFLGMQTKCNLHYPGSAVNLREMTINSILELSSTPVPCSILWFRDSHITPHAELTMCLLKLY
jgi:hypothetical protein